MGTILNLVTKFVADVSQYKSDVESATKTTLNMRSTVAGLASVGGAALGGLAAGVGIVGGAIGAAISKTDEWAGKMDSVQDILGGTNEEAAGMVMTVERVGGSVEQITGAIKKMSMGLVDNKGALGKSGQALKDLGVDIYDANGKLKTAYDIVGEVSTKISEMPDGLEKDAVLMTIFGKSGAELGDIMNAAANGGLKNFQDEAQKLGLAMDPQKAIDMEKAQAQLDQTITGLSITVGSALIPIITQVTQKLQEWLANPAIQSGLTQFGQGVANLAGNAVVFIPKVIAEFAKIATWLGQNEPLVVGLLAAMGVAVVAFGVSSAIAAATAMAPLLPIIAIMVAVGIAAAALYQAWTTNFGGCRDQAVAIWGFVQPLLAQMETWLKTNIPAALAWVSSSWETFRVNLFGVINQIISKINDGISAVNNLISAFGRLTGIKVPGIPTIPSLPASSAGRSGIPANKSNSDIFGASGIDNFKVPPGYNENFQVGVSSGEYVNVTRAPLGGEAVTGLLEQLIAAVRDSKLDERVLGRALGNAIQQGA